MEIYGIIEEKSMEDIEKEFEGKNYGIFKQEVADSIIRCLEPFHKKYNELMENPKYLEEICEKGAKKAKIETARNLIKICLSIDQISVATGLSISEIEGLKNS